MNNKYNIESLKGFTEIKDFKNYNELKPECGVYIFLSDKPIQRLVGSSHILKIGETSNLKRRMSAYFREVDFEQLKSKKGRQTAYRLSRYLSTLESYRLFFMPVDKTDLKYKEKELLELYYERHYEAPPLNMGMS
jgi:hypothetical protein